jgi:hypothetical protein
MLARPAVGGLLSDMRLLTCVFLASLLVARAAPVPEGFRPLFNGKDLEGWFGWGTEDPRKLLAMSPDDLAGRMEASMEDIRKHWTVENGELVNDGHGLYLSTREFFRDFELRLEYQTVPTADSGVYLRGCPQVQIWDSTLEANFKIGADKGSGGLWNNSPGAPGKDPLAKMDKPFGEWNSLRVVMAGEIVSVWLNGGLVVDRARMENYFDRGGPLPVRGPIQLQTHGGAIRWRNLFIRDLAPDAAREILTGALDEDGFEPLFNGSDLAGWQGATGGYEVKPGGILACKRGSGGPLLTEAEYGDFVFRCEFRLPPGGNNGIAVRTPAAGEPAWEGLEVQVLDDGHPKYANLKPWQVHGSIYGLVPAKTGYLYPTGEWNVQEVSFQGSKAKISVNGTVVIDVDLAKLDRAKIDKVPKGLDRARGHLGFAGHGDPVEFRNIRVKRLE